MRLISSIVTLVALAPLYGCATSQLRTDHIHQAHILTSIYEQQVLDNLAMFSNNPNATPFFALPGAGSAQVTDDGSLSISTLNGPARTVIGPLRFARNNRLTYAINPVTDVQRLRLMQCAYRRAVGYTCESDPCNDCCSLLKEWRGKANDDSYCCECCNIQPLIYEQCDSPMLTQKCTRIGTYCGKSIRICPASSHEFSKLVMLILEYATGTPKEAASNPVKTIDVEEYFYGPDDKLKAILKSKREAPVGNQEPQKDNTESGSYVPQFRKWGIVPETPRGLTTQPSAKQLNEIEKQILRDAVFPQL